MKRLFANGPALMLLASASFALMALFVKRVSRDIPEGEIMGFRSAVILAFSLAIAARQRRSLKGTRRGLLVVRGLFGAASMFAYFYAIHHLRLGDAVLLTYLSPLFVSLLSPLVLGERVPRPVWLALAVGFGGVWAVASGQPARGATELAGIAAGLVSAVFAAAAYTTVRKLSSTDDTLTIVIWFAAVALVCAVATFPVQWATPTPLQLRDLLLVGAFATIAQLLMTKSYSVAEAARVSIYGYATPIFSYFLAAIALAEMPGWSGAAGAALVLVAGVLASPRVLRSILGARSVRA